MRFRGWHQGREKIELLLLFSRKEEEKGRIGEILEMVGLGDRGDHLPGQLSGGEMQAVLDSCRWRADLSLLPSPQVEEIRIKLGDPLEGLISPGGDHVVPPLMPLNDHPGLR